jgi:hypothetical protein
LLISCFETPSQERRLAPVEVRPDLCPALAAGGADKARLDIGKPDLIGPAVCAEGDGMAATILGAIDKDAVHAHIATHLAEGDLLGSHDELFGR